MPFRVGRLEWILGPQLKIVGSHGKRAVDYAIEYKSSLIWITEVKAHESWNQTWGQIQASVHQKGRKHFERNLEIILESYKTCLLPRANYELDREVWLKI